MASLPHLALVLVLSHLLTAALSARVQAQEYRPATERLLVARPQNAQYAVDTELGVMVPYEAQLPGTQVRFRMLPIPGTPATASTPAIEPFWMGQYEVTWAEYHQYMLLHRVFRMRNNAQRIPKLRPFEELRTLTTPSEIYDPSLRFEFANTPSSPAVSMTQFAARQYTKWLSTVTKQLYRLPTEQEWQHACLAGSAGNWCVPKSELAEYAMFGATDNSGPAATGSLQPNAWGLHDMHGNVAEWVMEQSRLDAPAPKLLQHYREFRNEAYEFRAYGGSWNSSATECKASAFQVCGIEAWEEDPGLPFSPWWIANQEMCPSIGFRVVSPLRKIAPEDFEIYWRPDTSELLTDVTTRIEEGRGAAGLFEFQQLEWVQQVLEEERHKPRLPWEYGRQGK